MPIEFLAYVVQRTTWLQQASSSSVPLFLSALALLLLVLARRFFQGTANPYTDANMHGKVILLTGGTSGIGAAVARHLASRGAQLVLLVRDTHDGWTQEYIAQLRRETRNDLIFAEACDLARLSSVRHFATAWIDNTPVRRLDQVICCAGVALPPNIPLYSPVSGAGALGRATTADGVEVHFGTHYLAHHLLLAILAPALRAQQAERDVRVISVSCTLYMLGRIDLADLEFFGRGYPASRPWHVLGAAKCFVMSMTMHLQRLMDAHVRPDALPSRVKCICVIPGIARTPSFRRFISCGSLLGLAAYLATYPLWFICIKSAENAAQSILFASMAPSADVHPAGVSGGQIYQECRTTQARRKEINDPEFGEALWTATEQYTKKIETRSVLARKAEEKEKERQQQSHKEQKAK